MIESLIAAISPTWAARRREARAMIEQLEGRIRRTPPMAEISKKKKPPPRIEKRPRRLPKRSDPLTHYTCPRCLSENTYCIRTRKDRDDPRKVRRCRGCRSYRRQFWTSEVADSVPFD